MLVKPLAICLTVYELYKRNEYLFLREKTSEDQLDSVAGIDPAMSKKQKILFIVSILALTFSLASVFLIIVNIYLAMTVALLMLIVHLVAEKRMKLLDSDIKNANTPTPPKLKQ